MSERLGVLLHVGYPKAASSFLQDWFYRHPQLVYHHHSVAGVPGTVELHDLARSPGADQLRWLVTTDEDLAFWKGPIDPIGSNLQTYDVKEHQRALCRILVALHPTAKVLVVTRGFRSIMGSGYSQYLRVGGVMGEAEWFSAYGSLMRHFWDYDHLISLLHESFGRESVMVVPWELLRDDQQGFLRVITDALGIVDAEPTTERLKPGVLPEERSGYRRLSTLVAAAARRLPRDRGEQLYRWYSRQLAPGGFRAARRVAGAVRPGGDDEIRDDQVRSVFAPPATLRESSLHQPYLRDYLLDG